jgi:hypothetical protein
MRTKAQNEKCTCDEPVTDVMWEQWDGTCRRCSGYVDLTGTQPEQDDAGAMPAFLGGQGRDGEEVQAIGALGFWLAAALLTFTITVAIVALKRGGL